MYHARGMDDLQRFADLMRIVDGVRFAHRVSQTLAQAAAGKILQSEIEIVIGRAEVEYVRYRAVIQLGQDFAFLGEALAISLRYDVPSFNCLDFQGDRLREFVV